MYFLLFPSLQLPRIVSLLKCNFTGFVDAARENTKNRQKRAPHDGRRVPFSVSRNNALLSGLKLESFSILRFRTECPPLC